MKRKLSIITVLFILICPSLALAEVPKFISEGFKAFGKSGPEAAIERWTKGSVLENHRKLHTVLNLLQKYETSNGAYQGYDLFRSISIGTRSSIFFIIINFENAPLYSKFFAYRRSSGDVIIRSMDFNDDVEDGWPSELVYEN